MAGEAKVQVSQFLDEYGLGSFQIKLIVWSVLLAMIDGYDIGAIAFAAPHLIAEWHIPPKALGLVLSASNIGVLFGSQIFGWVGDRYGRKTALILVEHPVRRAHLRGRLFHRSDATVLAAVFRRARHRRRHPQPRRHQCRIGAAQFARDLGDHRRRPGAARRRHGRICRRGAGAAAMAGRSCSKSAASCRSCWRSPASSACRNRSNS